MFVQVALPMVGSIGLVGNLGENHETRISFDSGAFSATAHKHMYFILSLNQVFHDLHLYVFSIKYNEY